MVSMTMYIIFIISLFILFTLFLAVPNLVPLASSTEISHEVCSKFVGLLNYHLLSQVLIFMVNVDLISNHKVTGIHL